MILARNIFRYTKLIPLCTVDVDAFTDSLWYLDIIRTGVKLHVSVPLGS
jgi:hypothetical protein